MGGGLFRTSAKCSFHLFFTSSSFVSRMPSLLLMESVLLFGLLQSCLVASNTAFILPVLATFSASLAIWSIQFLLSLLSCFFTSLSLAWNSSLYVAFSLSDLVESTLALQDLLSSIFFQLAALIQGLLCFFLYPRTPQLFLLITFLYISPSSLYVLLIAFCAFIS